MLELQVPSKDCAPFLVSSTRDLLWVSASESGVRVGVRQCPPSDLFLSVVRAVADKGEAEGWDNVSSSLGSAVAHLEHYGLDYEVLVGKGINEEGFSCTGVPWLPAGWGVVVPLDRAYLGTVYEFGDGSIALLVHNAARGMAIVRPSAEVG